MGLIEFDKKVWTALKLIPRGRVVTYKGIAEHIGRPKAARAVGNACNKNPDAPLVPCHRVVRSDGSLGGYAGGSGKKPGLLRREGIKFQKNKIQDFKNKIYKFR